MAALTLVVAEGEPIADDTGTTSRPRRPVGTTVLDAGAPTAVVAVAHGR